MIPPGLLALDRSGVVSVHLFLSALNRIILGIVPANPGSVSVDTPTF